MTDPQWVTEIKKEIKRLDSKIRRLEAKQVADEMTGICGTITRTGPAGAPR